jgi:hypothetical protein
MDGPLHRDGWREGGSWCRHGLLDGRQGLLDGWQREVGVSLGCHQVGAGG